MMTMKMMMMVVMMIVVVVMKVAKVGGKSGVKKQLNTYHEIFLKGEMIE